VEIEDLAFFIEEDNRFEVYNGAYQLQVNKNHKEIELTKDFTVTGALTPKSLSSPTKAVQERRRRRRTLPRPRSGSIVGPKPSTPQLHHSASE